MQHDATKREKRGSPFSREKWGMCCETTIVPSATNQLLFVFKKKISKDLTILVTQARSGNQDGHSDFPNMQIERGPEGIFRRYP